MNMYAVFISLTLLTFTIICKLNSFGQANDEIWYPKHANRSYLTCPLSWCPDIESLYYLDERQSCCICDAEPVWYYPVDTTTKLRLEYVRQYGESVVIAQDLNSSFPTLIHNYGYMSKLPKNICSFSKIVTINLSHNKIKDIANISCLQSLDILDLSYNKIRHISHDTFIGNGNLRVLRLTHNGLKTLDPGTFNGDSLQIFKVDFSHNELQKIEFRNLISETDFCEILYSNNNITEITNTNNFTLDTDKNYYGGIVNLTGNHLKEFLQYEKLGIKDIKIFGKIIRYGFTMPDMKWDCNCHMEPYLELGETLIKKIWKDYANYSCWNPEEYRGLSIPDFVNEGKLHLFICNLTDNCPKNCHCFYQPKERRNVVDCNNANLTELPKELPESSNLTLILTNNQITELEYRPYLENASYLDLSGNLLTSIKKDAASVLKPDVILNLANNSIKSLPQELQILDPCSSNFGEVIVKCDCNSVWIQQLAEKARIKQCSETSKFLCQTTKGYILIENIDRNEICAEETSYQSIYVAIIFGLLASLLFGSALLAYVYRYEIYLIQRKYKYKLRKMSKIMPVMKYDVFLSFDEENDQLRTWVINVLVFNLEASGYRVFVPCRNLPPAKVREEELINYIMKCQNSIVVLCNTYKRGGTIWVQKEWKYIWHKFLDIIDRNVIVVNYDQLESVDNIDARLRAFVRLGYDIDFSNRNHDLITQIKKRLGPPIMVSWSNKNANTRFIPRKIYEKVTLDDMEVNFDSISELDNNTVTSVSLGNIIKVNISDME